MSKNKTARVAPGRFFSVWVSFFLPSLSIFRTEIVHYSLQNEPADHGKNDPEQQDRRRKR